LNNFTVSDNVTQPDAEGEGRVRKSQTWRLIGAFVVVVLANSGLGEARAQEPQSETKVTDSWSLFSDKDIGLRDVVVQTSLNPKILYKHSYALIISNTDYANDAVWAKLPANTDTEADALKDALEKQGFGVIREHDIDGRDLYNTILGFLQTAASYVKKDNARSIVYFTGHGWTDAAHLEGFLVGVGAPDPNLDPVGFRREALSTDQILQLAKSSTATHTLFIFDACFSGAAFETKSLFAPPSILRINDILKQGRQFLTSASEFEKSPATSQFTPFLIKGVSGDADLNHDGIVMASELAPYLKDKVTSSPLPTTPQYGDVLTNGGDFAFVYGASGGPIKPPVGQTPIGLFASVNLIYFRKAADGKALIDIFDKARIPYVTTKSILPQVYKSDGIACTKDTPAEAIKFVAHKMLDAGFPVTAITQIKNQRVKRTIQIISYRDVDPATVGFPLRADEIDKLTECPDRFVYSGAG
jgi:hypothetical protein